MTMYRQGDLLFILDPGDPLASVISRRDKGWSPVSRDGAGRIVLAEGEATGHAHAIHNIGASLYGISLEERYLEVLAEAGIDVIHEEHAPLHLQRGSWRVVRQREHEYRSNEGGTRWIAD